MESLEHNGVETVFAYPNGASIQIYKTVNDFYKILNVLPHHEKGGVFVAEEYATTIWKPGICIVNMGPGATNLITGLHDAMLDSVFLMTITRQVLLKMIWAGAFQNTHIVEVTRLITKHSYMVTDVEDITHIMEKAFFLTTSGEPRLVLIDFTKDVQQSHTVIINLEIKNP